MNGLGSIGRVPSLRAAINTGNRALVVRRGDTLGGVSPALARRLAARMSRSLETMIYDGAGKVFEDAGANRWDVAFLAVDPLRAERVSFTRPYHVIEATYAVRTDGPLRAIADVDAPGIRVLTSAGSAYDLHLQRSLSRAALDRSGTPGESFERFAAGAGDAVAGVRASLERAFGLDPAIRILDGVLTAVEQAMVLPGPDHPARSALDTFVAEAVADGAVARALAG